MFPVERGATKRSYEGRRVGPEFGRVICSLNEDLRNTAICCFTMRTAFPILSALLLHFNFHRYCFRNHIKTNDIPEFYSRADRRHYFHVAVPHLGRQRWVKLNFGYRNILALPLRPHTTFKLHIFVLFLIKYKLRGVQASIVMVALAC